MTAIRRSQLRTLIFLTLSILVFPAIAQDIPDKPVPPRLVNDFAGMLSRDEVNALERKLVAFNDSTSTQIAVVTVQTLDGYDIVDFATQLAEKWGIGQKGSDNGVLLLVKPKTADSNGEVTIQTGYGLEGVIPDITAAEIIDREMLPAFRNSDFYGGIDKATNTLMSLARGEFTADQYGKKSGSEKFPVALFIIIVIVILMAMKGGRRGGGRGRRITSSNDLPMWLLMSMLGSGGKSHGGSWGGFSGGGGGGFGGFGGGSFGGGGARGSW